MPDHFHLIWIGVGAGSDLRRATAVIISHLGPRLPPGNTSRMITFSATRSGSADTFASTRRYIAENPMARRSGR